MMNIGQSCLASINYFRRVVKVSTQALAVLKIHGCIKDNL